MSEQREVTEQNLDLLIEALLATAPEWFIWRVQHADLEGGSIHFASGYELSVRWGTSNYGSRRFQPDAVRTTVEIALFDKNRQYVRLQDCDDVLGWQDFGDIAALAQVIADNELERVAG